MKQFVLPADYAGERELTVAGRDFHYLHRVRRLSDGDTLAGRGRDGTPYRLTVLSVGEEGMRLRVDPAGEPTAGEGPRRNEPAAAGAPFPPITLYQCLPKGKKLDQIVRQTVEAGVTRIVPVVSAHAVKRPSGERAARQIERWRRIAEEAVQQSGRATVPAVEEICELADIPSVDPQQPETGLLFHEKTLADRRVGGYLKPGSRQVVLVIGPEGGLSDHEVSMLDRRGFNRVSLGPHVLRTETAALYAVAAVQSVYREIVAWKQ